MKRRNACYSNLKRLQDKQSSVNVRRSAHLRELALTLTPLPKDTASEEAELYRHEYEEICHAGELTEEDKIILCSHLTRESGHTAFFLSALACCSMPKRSCSIVYVKNALSDIACERFSRVFDKATVSYARDFTSALEDVYYSNADYVILPISSEKSGRMHTFGEMIQKYELKKVLVTSVYSNTDDTENGFALLSKSNEVLFPKGSENIYLEFTVNSPAESLPKIIKAAERFNSPCREIETNPERQKAMAVLDVTRADIDALCTYLALELPGHIPLGIYKMI